MLAYQPSMSVLDRLSVSTILIGAVASGAAFGLGSLALTPSGRSGISSSAKIVGVTTGLMRARPPQSGDYWKGCNDARDAGTAPIYRGEPGYRSRMDGDDDGIACEM